MSYELVKPPPRKESCAPDCLLRTDGSLLSEEVVSSLRFSTHCHYYLETSSMEIDRYPFLNKLVDDKKYNAYISTVGGEFSFGRNGVGEVSFFEEKSIDTAPELITSEFYQKRAELDSFDEAIVYLFLDFYAEISILGFLGQKEGMCSVLDHQQYDWDMKWLSRQCDELCGTHCKDMVLRLKVTMNSPNTTGFLSRRPDPFELRLLRASGINIPLVVVQGILKRKVKTFKFVDLHPIMRGADIFYNFPVEKVYFDLDGTLVWDSHEPIGDAIRVLEAFFKKGYDIILITRHIFDVFTTLNGAGIKRCIFLKIINVETEEKKSEFIQGPGVFIDNEFPERYDVSFNSNAISLDVDQLDFFRL